MQFPTTHWLESEQTKDLETLIAGTDVLTVLPTDFEKSVVYQVFCFAKISIACVLVISLLINIVVEQVKELGPLAIQSPGKDEDCMNAISLKTNY